MRNVFRVRGAVGVVRRFGVRQVLDAVYEHLEEDETGEFVPAARLRNPGGYLVWYLEHGGGLPRR